MGGRGSIGGSLTRTRLTEEDWDTWSEDPSIYQRLEKGEDLSEDFEDMWEDEWEEQYNRATRMAREIQNRAENETVNTSTLYRGERFNSLKEAQQKYAIGNTVTTNQLTSYSKDQSVAKSYATMYGKVSVIITNKNTKGNFVAAQTQHSGTKDDPEVIVARGLQSKVTDTRYDKSTNTLYVTMTNSATPKRRKR